MAGGSLFRETQGSANEMRNSSIGGKFYEAGARWPEKRQQARSYPNPFNALAGLDAVAGVKDYFLAFFQAFEHLRFGAACAACLHRTELRAAFAEDECSPARPAAKERAGGDF